MPFSETIAALASPAGAAARGVIRISGMAVAEVIDACFQVFAPGTLNKQQAWRRGGHWMLADCPVRIACDVLFWPNSRSYTGESAVELHLPGSPPVLEKVLTDIYLRGIRPARPGEFTLRSFLAGKIDLLQAEAVLGVINAQHETDLRTALLQLAGGISGRLANLRIDLLDLLADLEAGLDFVEEDLEFVSHRELLLRVATARKLIESLIEQTESRMTSSPLKTVVLAGLPNAGKSTLFNRLAETSLALVSPQEGTTRDYLRVELNWNGVPIELIDTAGFETGTGEMDALAQLQRAESFQRGQLIVWCTAQNLTPEQRQRDSEAWQRTAASSVPVLRIRTKADELSNAAETAQLDSLSSLLPISAHTGFGLAELRRQLVATLMNDGFRSSAWIGSTAARCRDSLERASAALRRAELIAEDNKQNQELLAIDLRETLDHLGQIVGAVYTDDLLDRIFSRFCIGK